MVAVFALTAMVTLLDKGLISFERNEKNITRFILARKL